MEIRVDSFKLVQLYRMPAPSFPTNIGIWSNVLSAIAVLSSELGGDSCPISSAIIPQCAPNPPSPPRTQS